MLAIGVGLDGRIAYAQQIVTDGRTQTNLAVTGNVTDVTTGTIRGDNAFNSFSKFNVDAGNRVNLHLPGSTQNLINVVTGQRTDIHGVLSSIQNGQIGGNVFFANPHGVVVGSRGVVNVGALSISTPPQSFVDGFFAGGIPSPEGTNGVLAGAAPLSSDGLISIRGKIQARGDVRLNGGDVENFGTIQSGARFAGERPDFGDIVNVNDYSTGTQIAVENGDIVIRAERDVINHGIIAIASSAATPC